MRNLVNNLSVGTDMYATDTFSLRNKQNSLLLIYKLSKEIDFCIKDIVISNKDGYSFEYFEDEGGIRRSFKSKNLLDFTFKFINFYYDILKKYPKRIVKNDVSEDEVKMFLLLLKFYRENKSHKKRICFRDDYYTFGYQEKKGSRHAGINADNLMDFLLLFVELNLNARKELLWYSK